MHSYVLKLICHTVIPTPTHPPSTKLFTHIIFMPVLFLLNQLHIVYIWTTCGANELVWRGSGADWCPHPLPCSQLCSVLSGDQSEEDSLHHSSLNFCVCLTLHWPGFSYKRVASKGMSRECPEGVYYPVRLRILVCVCVCLNSAPCGLPVRPCEHSEAAAGERSNSWLSRCHEAHAAVSRLWEGIQRCHTYTHQRWVWSVMTRNEPAATKPSQCVCSVVFL